MPAKWYEIKAAAKAADSEPTVAEVYVYGNIGDRWNEDGVIASDLVRDLAALEADQITLRINSYGGSVPDGLAIYNALKRHPAPVSVHIDGVAISCASYIAMAGDTITMAKNAQMMIHAPWSFAGGNAVELREQAEILDRYAKAMASAYADKSGNTYEDALAILTDGKDHWYLAEEAVAAGFADAVGDEIAVAASLASSFDLSRFKPTTPSASSAPQVSQPAAAAVTQKEPPMADPVQAAQKPAAPFARTLEDNTQVRAMFKPFMANASVAAMLTDVLADPSLTIDTIQAKLLTEVGKTIEPANPQGAHPRVETVADEDDKRRDAIVTALLVRAGVEKDSNVKASIASNPFRGHKLLDIARASLERSGQKTAYMTQLDVVAAAFTQGTSDFPILLENTMHKTLQRAYATVPDTWRRFCAEGSVSDFRAHNRYRTGSFGALDVVNELGEYVNKSIPDGEKSTIQAQTKGNIINISRKTIVNDELGAFLQLASDLGRAAAFTVESDVYALLAQNGGLGPTMGDGKTLFHADHGNLTTGAALSMAALDVDRVAMALQKDISGNEYLDLQPDVLVVPVGLKGTAVSVVNAQYDPDTTGKLQKPNMVNGLVRDIVGTARVSGTRRYMFADPNVAPVLEVAFLDGNSAPVLDYQEGFDVDGARWKVRMDYAVGAIDFRGAVTNAGQ